MNDTQTQLTNLTQAFRRHIHDGGETYKIPPTSFTTSTGAGVTQVTNDTNVTGSITGSTLTLGFTGSLSVPRGGTGVATIPAHQVIVGNTTGAINTVTTGTSGLVLTSNGVSADPTFQAIPTPGSTSEYDNGNATGTATITWTNSLVQYVTLTGNCTFTFASPTSGSRYVLHVAGAFTPTFPISVRWPGNVTPPATATSSYKDIYTFIYSGKESLYDGLISARYPIL